MIPVHLDDIVTVDGVIGSAILRSEMNHLGSVGHLIGKQGRAGRRAHFVSAAREGLHPKESGS